MNPDYSSWIIRGTLGALIHIVSNEILDVKTQA